MSICSSCRRSLLSRLSAPRQLTSIAQHRTAATAPATPNAAPSTPPPSTTQASTPATSSATPGISQPLSTPDISPQNTLPAATADLQQRKKAPGLTRTPSSCPAGSELRGVAYLKGVDPPFAMEDDQYPDWLWTILTPKASSDGALSKTSLAEMTKKQRAKYERKQERLRKSMPEKIPLHQQSIDLTGPGATAQESLAKRQELTKSQRDARRKEIREANFLKTM